MEKPVSNIVVDLSNLPKKSGGRIDWLKSSGSAIYATNSVGTKEFKVLETKMINKRSVLTCSVDNETVDIVAARFRNSSLSEFFLMPKFKVDDVPIKNCKVVKVNRGRSGITYTLKCIKCGEVSKNKIEENELNRGVGIKKVHNGTVCIADSAYNIEYIKKYALDSETLKHYTPFSHKRIKFKCDKCGDVNEHALSNVASFGYSCRKCSPKTSFLERFMMSYFRVKGINYQFQKIFEDFKMKRFDFYLVDSNEVCEVHGGQHYKDITFLSSEKVKKSDAEKQEYCSIKGIGYIEIDGRKHSIQFLQDQINKSKLPSIKDYELNDIVCGINELNYDVENFVSMHKRGRSIKEIANHHSTSESTVYKYLRGVGYKFKNPNHKQVQCIETSEVFPSLEAASRAKNTHSIAIKDVCENKRPNAGSDQLNENLTWRYFKLKERNYD